MHEQRALDKINQENKSRGAELLFNIEADMSDPDFHIICTNFESTITLLLSKDFCFCVLVETLYLQTA